MAGKESAKKSKKTISKQDALWESQNKLIAEICRDCGDDTMVSSAGYASTARYFAQDKFYVDFVDDKAFAYGIVNKKHFRLIAIAVKREFQGQGLSQVLLAQITATCLERGLEKITLRTHKGGKAFSFWQKMQAHVVGEKGDDFEMEIIL